MSNNYGIKAKQNFELIYVEERQKENKTVHLTDFLSIYKKENAMRWICVVIVNCDVLLLLLLLLLLLSSSSSA